MIYWEPFTVERKEPQTPMGWEIPVAAEPFLVRETSQYVINRDAVLARWDAAYLQDDLLHQISILSAVEADHKVTQEEWAEARERARSLLSTQIPANVQHVHLKLPHIEHSRYA